MSEFKKRMKRRNSAFTLTELTVALAVSAVALMLVLTLSVIAVRTVQSGERLSAQLNQTYNAKELISDFFYSFDSKDFSVESPSSSKVAFVSQSQSAEMEFSQGKLILDSREIDLDLVESIDFEYNAECKLLKVDIRLKNSEMADYSFVLIRHSEG